MHESMRRLLEFARRATEARRPAERVSEFSDIGRKLKVSSAVMTNWKARGISKEGALDAQQAFGCNAWWLMTGTGPQAVDSWPFPLVDRRQWDGASEAERGYIQHAIRAAFADIERQREAADDAPTVPLQPAEPPRPNFAASRTTASAPGFKPPPLPGKAPRASEVDRSES